MITGKTSVEEGQKQMQAAAEKVLADFTESTSMSAARRLAGSGSAAHDRPPHDPLTEKEPA